jgi:hypothetical protein
MRFFPLIPNPAHALDAAMSFSSHIGRHWRGASDVHRWPKEYDALDHS